MKILFFLLILTVPLGLRAQINESDFKQKEWFSDKKIDSFFNSDTISLIQVLKYNDKKVQTDKLFKKHLNKTYDHISILTFLEKSELDVTQLIDKPKNKIKMKGKWEYNADKRILNIYVNEELNSSFGFSSNMDGDIAVSNDLNNNKIQLKFREIIFTRLK